MPITTFTVHGVLVDGSSPVTLIPTVQNVSLPKGVDARFLFDAKNSAGAAVDLTGAAVRLSVWSLLDPTDVRVQSLGTPTNAVGGLAELTVPGAHTADLDPDTYGWDITVEFPNGVLAQLIPASAFDLTPSGTTQPTALIEVPTMSGQSGKALGTDGAALAWTFVKVAAALVAESGGPFPAALSVPGAKVGQKVVSVVGLVGGALTDCSADFEAAITADGAVQQLSQNVVPTGPVYVLIQ